MAERYYLIAGITVRIIQDNDKYTEMFSGFETGPADEPDVTVRIWEDQHTFHQWYGVDYCRASEDFPHIFTGRTQPRTRLLADGGWRNYSIEGARFGTDGVMETFLCAFYSYLAGRNMVLSHASCVSHQGEGIIFTAASGTGKTTQAELWEKHRQAEIINGDKVILECGDQNCYAWGSPWKGSSPYAVNKRVPLKAVIVLSQAEQNRLSRLDTAEAAVQFFPHVFFPSWNGACAEKVMKSLDSLMRQVPVYHLACRPDEEAVELVEGRIWGEI